MKISVITVVYNNITHIESCIQSVLNQSYKNIEYIIIDGGSSDGTWSIIEKYKQKLAYSISEKDKGIYNALNKGIRVATGDVIGVLHSDDLFYDTDTLQQIVEYFERTDADLVYANGLYISNSSVGTEGLDKIKRIYKSKPFRKRLLNFGWIPLHTTIYVRNSVFKQYGLYDESYAIAADYEISQRWFREEQVKKVFLDLWVVKMRLGGKSTSATLQKRKSEEDLRVIRKYGMWGGFTLACKIVRKIPQYLFPVICGGYCVKK